MNSTRSRGSASGWVVLVVILAVLGSLVAWKMIKDNRTASNNRRAAATQHD